MNNYADTFRSNCYLLRLTVPAIIGLFPEAKHAGTESRPNPATTVSRHPLTAACVELSENSAMILSSMRVDASAMFASFNKIRFGHAYLASWKSKGTEHRMQTIAGSSVLCRQLKTRPVS